MNLGIVGSGYVGLTTGICLASLGHKISIYDNQETKLEKIKQGKLPFFEIGLEEILSENLKKNNIIVCKTVDDMIKNTEGCFVCVGTPSEEDNKIDLSQIKNSINEISKGIQKNNKNEYLIIVRSTIVPNTTKNIILPIIEQNIPTKDFQLAIVPEFLREGKAFDDFMHPDKIVIGCKEKQTGDKVKKIFEFFGGKCEFIITNFETAEMIKYTNNSFFAMLISFSNEIANISEQIRDVDAFQVLRALVFDKRITSNNNGMKTIPGIAEYLAPGCGFGGSCFPKDVKAITSYASTIGTETPILNAILEINEKRSEKIISLVKKILTNIEGKQITILGLSFKPDTNDMRSSPSISIIKILQKMNAKIFAYDPKVTEEDLQNFGISGVKIGKNIDDSLKNSDLAILLTKWDEFACIDEKLLENFMRCPVIIDGRGFLDQTKFSSDKYFKIGFME